MENRRGDSDQITRDYFDSLLLEMRHIDGRMPDTTFTLYGERFETPIMLAALSHLENVRENGMVELAKGAASAGAVNWAGMGDEAELENIVATGAKTIKIIKPYADNRIILRKIEHAEKCGALAVGIDVDHAFNGQGGYDCVLGFPMAPKSMEEIREFAASTSLPFLVKGVLGSRDAYKCLMAGAAGIVVSHHHGIMDYALPPLLALPDILKAVGGQMPVFIDCGILSGMDAFKALALGATAVSAGRIFLKPLGERGGEGVAETVKKMNGELKGAMARTGCYDLAHMDSTVIRYYPQVKNVLL